VLDLVRLVVKKVLPDSTTLNELLDYFKLTGEFNVPALYSTLLLLIAGILLLFVHKTTDIKKHKIFWLSLGVVFIFLAFDEAFKIHEGLSQLIRSNYTVEGSVKYGTWAIPYLLITAVIGLLYLRFVLSLPKFTRILIIVSGAIYVGGAAGFELLEGYFYLHAGEESLIYKLFHSSQEILEMVGIVLFNYTLLDYLALNKTTIEIAKPEISIN
jgi:hypothetical protein